MINLTLLCLSINLTIFRLRYILHQLNSGQLPLEDLKRNIEYAALVLETAYLDETRRICDEDDDLAGWVVIVKIVRSFRSNTRYCSGRGKKDFNLSA